MLGVALGGFARGMSGVQAVGMGEVGMMAALFMVAVVIMLGGLLVVMGGLLVMVAAAS